MTEGSNTAGVRTVMVPHTNERTSRNIMPDVSTSEDSNKILKQVSATSQGQQNGTHPIRSECTRWFLISLIFFIFHFIFYHILIYHFDVFDTNDTTIFVEQILFPQLWEASEALDHEEVQPFLQRLKEWLWDPST